MLSKSYQCQAETTTAQTVLCTFYDQNNNFSVCYCNSTCYHLHCSSWSFISQLIFKSHSGDLSSHWKSCVFSLQECHSHLLRHRNTYLQHVKQIIKAGGPWENPVLQGILKEADLPPKEGRLMNILNSWYGLHIEYCVKQVWQLHSSLSHTHITNILSDRAQLLLFSVDLFIITVCDTTVLNADLK